MRKEPRQPIEFDHDKPLDESKIDPSMRREPDESREFGQPLVFDPATLDKNVVPKPDRAMDQLKQLAESLKATNRQVANFDLVPGLMDLYLARLMGEAKKIHETERLNGLELRARVLEEAAAVASHLFREYKDAIEAALDDPHQQKRRTQRPPDARAA